MTPIREDVVAFLTKKIGALETSGATSETLDEWRNMLATYIKHPRSRDDIAAYADFANYNAGVERVPGFTRDMFIRVEKVLLTNAMNQ